MKLPFRKKQSDVPQTPEEIFPEMAKPVIGSGSPKHRKRNIILALLLGLVLLSGGWYLFIREHKPAAPAAGQTSEQAEQGASPFYPRFDSVASVVKYADADWYAVNGGVIKVQDEKASYFSSAQGVPPGVPVNLAAYNNRLWLATQQGVVSLNKDGTGFDREAIPEAGPDLANARLFVDDNAYKLYLSTFEKLYVYDEKTAVWSKVTGPANVMSFAANDKHAALYASHADWPVWVYDKAADRWKKQTPPIEQQSGTVVKVNEEVIVLGRSAGYTSCDSAGKVAATSAFRLDENGAWQPLAEFNADKKRPELNVLRSASGAVRVKTSKCDGTEPQTYSLEYKEGGLKLVDEKAATHLQAGALEDVAEQAELVGRLKKATGLQPSMHVWDIDGKGNAIFSYATGTSGSSVVSEPFIGVATGNNLTQTKMIKMDTLQGRDNIPILCGSGEDRKLTYIFSGEVHIASSGHEGFPDGTWKSARIYIADDTATTLKQAVDLGEDLAAPVFTCDDDYLVWLGKSHVKRMDRTTNAVSPFGQAVGTNLTYRGTTAAATKTGGLWFGMASPSDQPNTGSLYFYDPKQDNYALVAQKINVDKLSAATDNAVVVYANPLKEHSQALYDRKGKVASTFETVGPVVYAEDRSQYIKLRNEPAANNPTFIPYSLSSYTPDAAPQKLSLTNNGFTTRYDIDQSLSTGMFLYPTIVYDQRRNSVWLNDSMFGVNVLGLPK